MNEGNYSMTQGGNVAVFASATVIVIQVISGAVSLGSLTQEQFLVLFAAGTAAIGAAISWIGRFRKGDLTPLGFRKV